MANPMNQARLSQLPLYSLGKLFQGEDVDLDDILHEACTVLCPKKLGEMLYEDSALFQDAGLEGISTETENALCASATLLFRTILWWSNSWTG